MFWRTERGIVGLLRQPGRGRGGFNRCVCVWPPLSAPVSCLLSCFAVVAVSFLVSLSPIPCACYSLSTPFLAHCLRVMKYTHISRYACICSPGGRTRHLLGVYLKLLLCQRAFHTVALGSRHSELHSKYMIEFLAVDVDFTCVCVCVCLYVCAFVCLSVCLAVSTCILSDEDDSRAECAR